jgi:type IV pilus assembly protein PilB
VTDESNGTATRGHGADTSAAVAPAAAIEGVNAGNEIGAILVLRGLITAEQLVYARRIQSKLPRSRALISVLEELQFASPEQVHATLSTGPVAVPLGRLMIELGYIRDSDLQTALALQKERPGAKIGAVLVENHFVLPDQLLAALSVQLGIESLDPRTANPDPLLFQSTKWLRANDLFPMGRRDGAVVIAFADPLNPKHVETAKKIFGKNIIVGIARADDIHDAIERLENQRVVTASTVASENLIVQTVNQLLSDAVEINASDIHVEPQKDRMRIRFRLDGVLVDYKQLPFDMVAPMISRIKILANADIAEKRRHQDGRILFTHKGASIDFRVSMYASIHGETVVLRLLNTRSQLLDIKQLGMGPRMFQRFVEDVLDAPGGVALVTGPTGSGKTTTLYSSVQYLNNPQVSIITAEDPVEYVVDGISQCSINPRINVTFEDALKHMVRQDPDVIVVGEVRDVFSAQAAIQAALTGHKVLTTFHTEDSIGGLVRLLNMNIEAFLVSSTVISVLAQRLLRRVCSHCAEDQMLTPHQARRLGYEPRDVPGLTFKLGRGCSQCRFMGYKGRIAVFELLVLNEPVKDAVLAQKSSYEIRRMSIETSGLVTLLEDSIYKAIMGLTTFDEIIRQIPRLGRPRPVNEIRRLLGELQ